MGTAVLQHTSATEGQPNTSPNPEPSPSPSPSRSRSHSRSRSRSPSPHLKHTSTTDGQKMRARKLRRWPTSAMRAAVRTSTLVEMAGK